MKPPLSHAPLLPVALAFAAGILVGTGGVCLWWVLVPVVAAVWLWIWHRDLWAVVSLVCVVGWLAGNMSRPPEMPDEYAGLNLRWYGSVRNVNETAGGRILTVDIDSVDIGEERPESAGFCASWSVPSLFPAVAIGDKVEVKGILTSLSGDTDLPDEVDYSSHLRRNGITAGGVAGPDDISVTDRVSGFKARMNRIRSAIVRLIASASVSEETCGLMMTLLVGNDDYLPDGLRQDYSSSGLAHVLAVSGLHVGIIAMVVAMAMWPLYVLRRNKLRLLLTMASLWCYAMITGMPPSVVRAVVMASVMLVGRVVERRSAPVNSLSLAAILILIVNPHAIYSVGFQLSFCAVAAIITIVPVVNRVDRRAHPVWWRVVSGLAVPVAAVIGTGIVSAFYFHSFPVYFLIANLLMVFMAGPFVMAGVLLVICESVGSDPAWICCVLDVLAAGMNGMASWVSALPGSTIDRIYFPSWLLIPYFVMVGAAVFSLWSRRPVYATGALALAVATLIILWISPSRPADGVEIYVVGRSYRTDVIIRDHDRCYMMTSAMRHERETVLAECRHRYADYLGRRGIDSLEALPDTLSANMVSRVGRLLSAGGRVITVVDSEDDTRPLPVKPDYALVCRGFKGDVGLLKSTLDMDTVILSADIHKWRHDRYLRELKSAGVPVISLRDGAFRLVLTP